MDDTQAARAAFEAWFARWPYPEARVYASNAWFAAIDYARSIPAAAALLREAGWTVGWKQPTAATQRERGGEQAMTRDEQIEALARRMWKEVHFGKPGWEDISVGSVARSILIGNATIAIELAEATRDECWALTDRTWPEADDLLDAIAAMPLPIADGGGDG